MFLPGEDETGWNSGNNDTMDDVGSERGNVPGRAVDGGAGSSNFQFAAPAMALDGRGIDPGLLFSYNSRVWHKAGSEITFDIDRDWIAGWSLGFGKIVMAGDTYMLIDGDGTRHPYQGTLRGDFPAPLSSLQSFEAHTTDGAFIDYYAEGYKPQFDAKFRNAVVETVWRAFRQPLLARIAHFQPGRRDRSLCGRRCDAAFAHGISIRRLQSD